MAASASEVDPMVRVVCFVELAIKRDSDIGGGRRAGLLLYAEIGDVTVSYYDYY